MNAKIFRDIDALRIWGNDNGMRFLRDPDDKTKYKVCFTDDDLDKLEAFILQQQAEIEALKQIIDANNLIQNIGQFVKPQEKCPPTSWWKGDPTCGGITENYGLGKKQEK